MLDVFVYYVDLPPGIHEIVTPCADGYTVYLNIQDDLPQRMKSLHHAMEHIRRNDFSKEDVQAIEHECHGGDI